MIKTWQQRCEEHPDHEGIVTDAMIRERMQEEIDELRQALAQPEPEPVGYVTNSGTAAYLHRGVYLEDDTPLYIAPPREEGCAECGKRASDGWALYCVGCSERGWVGLTADEIWKCNKAETGSAVEFHVCSAHQNVMDFAKAIESKLKERNS